MFATGWRVCLQSGVETQGDDVMQLEQEQLAGYDAAREGVAFWRVPEPGWILIAGDDRTDFVQRQTTNDVRLLAPDRAQLTVLTSATARILDVWRLVALDDAIGTITLPGRGASTAHYLQRRIFFMDKVTVTDASDTLAQIDLLGPGAAGALAALGVTDAPAPDTVAEMAWQGETVRVLGQSRALGLGWRLLVPRLAAKALESRLAEAGARGLAGEAYETVRVEAGLPAAGRELTDAYTPLETGLRAAVHEAKGCYTGQEVLARQINYDKITRQMVGLRLETPVQRGAAVQVEGRGAGEVTSAVVSPRFGAIALAVVKRPHFEPGTVVMVASGEETARGEVVSLPFA